MGDHEQQVLERRVGRLHAKQRLGVEQDHEAQLFGQGLTFFHFENSALFALAIEYSLKLTGLFWRGCKNAEQVKVRYNHVRTAELPEPFDGFTILHLSDLHCDLSERAIKRVAELLTDLKYDLCVLTGDLRGKTFGSCEVAIATVADLRSKISAPIYGVLGNHDSIRMVPDLEKLGIRMLVNESDKIERGGRCIYVAGVDDAHYFRADNLEKASDRIPYDAFSVLLSHTPEIYRQAAHAGFNLFLCGHTHGGQICLPGGIPITLSSSSVLPRRMGAGSWKHHAMNGYTSVGAGSSVVPVRFNCPPEITLHYLEKTR